MRHDAPMQHPDNAFAIEPTDVPLPPEPKRPKAADDNRGKIESIHIDFAQNGSMVRIGYEPKKVDKKKNRWDQMPEPEERVFETPENLLAYLGEKLSPEIPEIPEIA